VRTEPKCGESDEVMSQQKWRWLHCKKAFVILTTAIVPLWQPAMSIQHTWSTGKLLQGLGSLLRHQISAIHNT